MRFEILSRLIVWKLGKSFFIDLDMKNQSKKSILLQYLKWQTFLWFKSIMNHNPGSIFLFLKLAIMLNLRNFLHAMVQWKWDRLLSKKNTDFHNHYTRYTEVYYNFLFLQMYIPKKKSYNTFFFNDLWALLHCTLFMNHDTGWRFSIVKIFYTICLCRYSLEYKRIYFEQEHIFKQRNVIFFVKKKIIYQITHSRYRPSTCVESEVTEITS